MLGSSMLMSMSMNLSGGSLTTLDATHLCHSWVELPATMAITSEFFTVVMLLIGKMRFRRAAALEAEPPAERLLYEALTSATFSKQNC